MATLLTMVNDLRVRLRDERVTTILSADELTQQLIALINRAAVDVLESRTWSFDKRYDGVANTLPKQTGTGLTATTTTVRITYTLARLLYMSGNDRVTQFRVTNDALRPNLSWRVAYADSTTNPGDITMTFTDAGGYGGTQGTITDATWELYSMDLLLPSTVRKVLSVRDETQPTHLQFFEDEIFGDRAWPNPGSEDGKVAFVSAGGMVTATYNTDVDSSANTGMRLSLLPLVASTGDVVYYSYVYRHPSVSSATDTFVNVPDKIIGLIIDRAFYFCLSSNIEADSIRAASVLKQWRLDLELAGREDVVMPNRRRVLRPIASRGYMHPNSRWATREVPSP